MNNKKSNNLNCGINMEKIQPLKNLLIKNHYSNSKTILIVAAGFEKRCIAVIEHLKQHEQKLDEILIIDYNDAILNEPERSKIISSANKISQRITIFEDLDFDSLFKLNNSKLQKKILICSSEILTHWASCRRIGFQKRVNTYRRWFACPKSWWTMGMPMKSSILSILISRVVLDTAVFPELISIRLKLASRWIWTTMKKIIPGISLC